MFDTRIAARADADRLRQIRDDLLPRMRRVCPTMPNDLFHEMIERMAALQLKYELRGASHDADAR